MMLRLSCSNFFGHHSPHAPRKCNNLSSGGANGRHNDGFSANADANSGVRRQALPDVEIVTRLPDKSLHRYSYGEFHRRTHLLAAALEDAGLKRGERVATIMWNSYAHLEAYFAVPCAGGVLHTLNFRLHENDIAYIANHAQDRFLIVDDVLLPIYERIKDKVKFERVFVVPFTGAASPDGLENYEDFLADGRTDYTFPNLSENEDLGDVRLRAGIIAGMNGIAGIYSICDLAIHPL